MTQQDYYVTCYVECFLSLENVTPNFLLLIIFLEIEIPFLGEIFLVKKCNFKFSLILKLKVTKFKVITFSLHNLELLLNKNICKF